jgi:hypothetical protein
MAAACWTANRCRLGNTAFCISLTFTGVQSECGCPVGLKSINNPASHYSDIQNNRELQVAANVCQTAVTVPCCITVILLALTNNSAVTIHCSTVQNFMWLSSIQQLRGTMILPTDTPTVTDQQIHLQ